MKEAVVRTERVSKIYNTNSHHTAGVVDLSFVANSAELVLILGPSGSGKTTLLTLIAGFIQPTSGLVLLFNRNLQSYSQTELQRIRATQIGFVFQSFRLIEAINVRKNVQLCQKFAGKSGKESYNNTISSLKRFGIEHLANRYPRQLSQGEKQRVAIARAIVNDANLILADEPTASLESNQGIEIIQLLNDYAHKDGKCVLVASHDLRLINYADRVVKIENGRIV